MKTSFDHLNQFRAFQDRMPSNPGDKFGAFVIPRGSMQFTVIASCGSDEVRWEHVSARCRDYKGERCPSWDEMCWLKDLFWEDTECVIQFHPPKSEYVNLHPHVLHLWRDLGNEIARPPTVAV